MQAPVLVTMVEQASAAPLAGFLPATIVVGTRDSKPEVLVAVLWKQDDPRAAVHISQQSNPIDSGLVSALGAVPMQANDQLFAGWSGHLPGNLPRIGAAGRPAAAPWPSANPRLAVALGGREHLIESGAACSEGDAVPVTTPSERSFSNSWQVGVGEWSLAGFMVAAALAGPPDVLGDKVKDRVFAGLASGQDVEGISNCPGL